MATALLLAKAGVEVTILEKQPRVGGRTSAIESDGYRFDLGPTFFLYPQILEEIFQAVGRDLHQEVPMTKLDPQYRITFGAGGELNATPDLARMEAEIAKLSPPDAPQFRRFMEYNRRKLEKFAPCLQTPFLGWKSLLSARLLAVLPYLKPWKSLHAELADYFHDPRLQLAFTFQSKYLGMSPFQCPSLFSILSFLEYEHGIWHPTGGCNALTRGMARVAQELGVQIRLNSPVEQILFTGRRAVGVRTAQGEERADAVIVNADFAHAMTRLVPNACATAGATRKSRGKISPAPPSCCIWAWKESSINSRTTTFTSRKITGATWTKSSGSTCCPKTPPFTSPTRRAPMPRCRRRATAPCMCCSR